MTKSLIQQEFKIGGLNHCLEEYLSPGDIKETHVVYLNLRIYLSEDVVEALASRPSYLCSSMSLFFYLLCSHPRNLLYHPPKSCTSTKMYEADWYIPLVYLGGYCYCNITSIVPSSFLESFTSLLET